MMTGNKVLVCLALVGSLGFRADVDTRGLSPRHASGAPDDCQPPKALVCHIPPDDPESTHNMCLTPNATSAHLRHGDTLGECATCSPTPEVCGDGIDNDCDGLVDEGCLGNRAWHDADLNGVQDSGELGVPGATFMLRAAATGALIAIAVSDSAGIFSFSNVPAGSYYMEVVPPTGFSVTVLNAGPDDTLDSDFDTDTFATVPFTVDSAGSNDIDCGLITSSAHESLLRH